MLWCRKVDTLVLQVEAGVSLDSTYNIKASTVLDTTVMSAHSLGFLKGYSKSVSVSPMIVVQAKVDFTPKKNRKVVNHRFLLLVVLRKSAECAYFTHLVTSSLELEIDTANA